MEALKSMFLWPYYRPIKILSPLPEEIISQHVDSLYLYLHRHTYISENPHYVIGVKNRDLLLHK